MAQYLIPGSVGEHASKEGVHVASIHSLAVLLDALNISKDQALPQKRIALPELICDLPGGRKVLRYGNSNYCSLYTSRRMIIRTRASTKPRTNMQEQEHKSQSTNKSNNKSIHSKSTTKIKSMS